LEFTGGGAHVNKKLLATLQRFAAAAREPLHFSFKLFETWTSIFRFRQK
jgi:hypothetical protein